MFGNTFGILGLFYAVTESLAQNWLDHTVPDEVSSVLAGLVTGGLYRGAAGPRSIAIGCALGGLAATGLVAAKATLPVISGSSQGRKGAPLY